MKNKVNYVRKCIFSQNRYFHNKKDEIQNNSGTSSEVKVFNVKITPRTLKAQKFRVSI